MICGTRSAALPCSEMSAVSSSSPGVEVDHNHRGTLGGDVDQTSRRVHLPAGADDQHQVTIAGRLGGRGPDVLIQHLPEPDHVRPHPRPALLTLSQLRRGCDINGLAVAQPLQRSRAWSHGPPRCCPRRGDVSCRASMFWVMTTAWWLSCRVAIARWAALGPTAASCFRRQLYHS